MEALPHAGCRRTLLGCMMKRIDLIAGARPNFMKIAPIIDALKAAEARGGSLCFRLIHTGQHYDRAMSGSFFEELGIPEPDINLEVGSGTQAEQTAAIMVAYEKVLLKDKSDLCLVVGDVTSTMACAIAARKLGVPVAHVEGGIRSGDWTMPEEINRVVTDSITNWFFTTSETANDNLRRSGIPDDHIFFVGNTMIDTLARMIPMARELDLPGRLGVTPGEYAVLTLHRPSNVDVKETLENLLGTLEEVQNRLPIVFPIHPRTRKNIDDLGLLTRLKELEGIRLCDPLSYMEFLNLYSQSRLVLTDSGGIQEETSWLRIPCVTLRENTERYVTVELGSNYLVGTDRDTILAAVNDILDGRGKKGEGIPLWDGATAERIRDIFVELAVKQA